MPQTSFIYGLRDMSSNGAFFQPSEAFAILGPRSRRVGVTDWEPVLSVLPMNWAMLTCLLGIDDQKTGGLSLWSQLLAPMSASAPFFP